MGRPRILIASDGTEPVLRACRALAALAAPATGEVRILTVLSYDDLPVDEESGAPSDPLHPNPALVDHAVRVPRQILEGAGHMVDVKTRLGEPVEEILDETQDWAPDLLVIGRRRMTEVEQKLLGSVSKAVIRGVTVPVLLSI